MITVSGYSQDIYPKLVLPGSSIVARDTLVLITLSQMDSVNNTFIWNDQYRATIDTLTNNLQTVYRLSHIADSVSKQLLSIADARIVERDQLISSQEKLAKHQKKLINRLRALRTTLGISTGIFAIIAIVLLILP